MIDPRTIRFDLKDRISRRDHSISARACRCFRTSGALDADGRHKPLRPDRQRVPDHQRPVHDRAGRFGPAPRVRAQPGLLGARPRRAARLLQFRPRRLPLLPGRRGRASRRSRRASSTCCSNIRRATWARQHAGPKWRDGRIVKTSSRRHSAQGLQSYEFNLRRPTLPGHPRARMRSALTYDFETLNRYQHVQARLQPVQQHASSPPSGLPSTGRARAARAVPRARCRRRCSGRRGRRRAPDTGPHALRANLLEARALLEAAGWKHRRATARCATRRASRSSSNT